MQHGLGEGELLLLLLLLLPWELRPQASHPKLKE